MKSIAVVFPGIGYHVDKPLLYYSKKMAREMGYEIREVPYKGFSKKNMIGNARKMQEAFEHALEQTEEMLSDVRWEQYGQILFLSKSVGTAVACAYAGQHSLHAHHVYYTPVEGTFRFMQPKSGIAFHGTADPWVTTDIVKAGCQDKEIPLYITEGANHSLETGHVPADLANLTVIMEQTRAYLLRITRGCYRVAAIREDDYGCEELPEGAEVMSQVILEDSDGGKRMLRYPDRELIDQDIRSGDDVWLDEEENLHKA